MRDWWTASLTKVKATQTCLFQTPSYLREATWSQCPKLTTIWLFSEGVYRRSLADWLTADVGLRAVGLNSPRCRTPKAHAISSRSPRSCMRPCWLGISTNQRADGSISESLLSRNSTSGYIGGELMSILSKYAPVTTWFPYYELHKTKGERYAQFRINEPR